MRFLLQTTADDLLEIAGEVDGVWEGEGARFDFSVCFFDIFGFEGRASVGQSVADDPEAPDIHLAAMSFRFQDFGCDVIWSSTNSFSFFSWVLKFSR